MGQINCQFDLIFLRKKGVVWPPVATSYFGKILYFWSLLLVRCFHAKSWPYILWGNINVNLGINIAIDPNSGIEFLVRFGYFRVLLFGTFFCTKFGYKRNKVKTRQIWGNWLSVWPRIFHANDSWPTYITPITPDKCSNAPKNSKESGLNKSVTSS